MSGKRATPQQRQQIVTMREAGWTIPAIAERTGLSVSTVKRTCRHHKVMPGKAQVEAIEAARQELRQQFDDVELKTLYGELLADTVAQVRMAREKGTEALEALQCGSTKEAALTLRALAAHSTSTKNHADTIRHLAPPPEEVGELPELVIRVMTQEETQAMRQQQRREYEQLTGEPPGDIPEEETDDEDKVVELD